ncbi:M28 family metallopeptidase [Tenacibaculum sp. ZS6-P6]|uniref:M28 family metallopeptidase n=1 Tax=Tenacibaculum sp. ZS6-P6 TaxID=3447503 RepID=UPI003F961FB4
MKNFIFAACSLAMITYNSSAQQKNKSKKDDVTIYAETITAKDLGKHLFIYASDEFEGRNTGEPGQKKAVNYLKDFYINEGIASPLGGNNYFQKVPSAYLSNNRRGKKLNDSENVVAFIKGTEKPDEIIVISAHLDHEGVKNGKIYNGADDDGSGTVAILEIAQAFKKAANEGKGPKRSILFLHVTAEEKGLIGSRYYTENPIFPLKNTVTDLNIDMIGRIDARHKGNPNYVYLIGSDKLSTELHNISEEANKKYMNINLDYKYNDENDPNRFYYRSDHYNFAKHNIPIIFYFNGTHADYHQPTDTPDRINYELLENRTRLVFYTAWEVANRKNRIVVDKAQ